MGIIVLSPLSLTIMTMQVPHPTNLPKTFRTFPITYAQACYKQVPRIMPAWNAHFFVLMF